MKTKEILKYFTYVPSTGEVFIHRGDKNRKSVKRIIPDEYNYAKVQVKGEKLKIKFANLVWCLVQKVKPRSDQVVFHKDLDETNFKINNLMLLPRSEYNRVQEALKNLKENLKVIPHPTDQFSYVLEYREDGRLKREKFGDLNIARKKMLTIQIHYTKLVSKYIVTE